jgi:hypothetical protein
MPIPPMGLWAYLLEQEKSKEIRRGRASSLSDTSRDRPSSSDSCAGSETVDTSSEDGADDAVYNTSSDISEEEANERTSIILPDIITPAINTASVTEAFKLIIDTEAAIDETELKNYFERFGPFHTFEVNSTHVSRVLSPRCFLGTLINRSYRHIPSLMRALMSPTLSTPR